METDIDFATLSIRHRNWRLVWDWIGEGNSGDFDPNDPDDKPLLRADVWFVNPDGSVLEPQDSSYCTLATPWVSKEELFAGAMDLLTNLPEKFEDWSSRPMEQWTWREYN